LPHMRGGEGNALFDLVFVDAPCSGTGTWRRQPELRWRITPERLAELMATQDALLDKAASLVKPGGRIVYATCSVLPCENADRIAAFLNLQPGFALRSARCVWPEAAEAAPGAGYFLASPLGTGTDGFFAAILDRVR
ncbi:MAG: hypothetical protein ACREMY_24590, partial [bacterium]